MTTDELTRWANRTPPTRTHMTRDQFNGLWEGSKWEIDSGMGGAFTMEFTGKEKGVASFHCTARDYTGYRIELTMARATSTLFRTS